MGPQVFGRTNRSFPTVWLSLGLPYRPDESSHLVKAAVSTGLPLDISSQPALWGGQMRGTSATLLAVGGAGLNQAPDEEKAFASIHAHLIELMSAVGRDWIDIYFLRIRGPLQEHQISGALSALTDAREDGVIRHVGVYVEGSPHATRLIWQFNDAFELALLPPQHVETLRDLAVERRAGIVLAFPTPDERKSIEAAASLLRVRSRAEVEELDGVRA